MFQDEGWIWIIGTCSRLLPTREGVTIKLITGAIPENATTAGYFTATPIKQVHNTSDFANELSQNAASNPERIHTIL